MPRIPSASIKQPDQAPVAAVRPRKATQAPTPEDIRVRAYEIYLARGAQPGREVDDWTQAERELRVPANLVTR
jgi:hypothetical protein